MRKAIALVLTLAMVFTMVVTVSANPNRPGANSPVGSAPAGGPNWNPGVAITDVDGFAVDVVGNGNALTIRVWQYTDNGWEMVGTTEGTRLQNNRDNVVDLGELGSVAVFIRGNSILDVNGAGIVNPPSCECEKCEDCGKCADEDCTCEKCEACDCVREVSRVTVNNVVRTPVTTTTTRDTARTTDARIGEEFVEYAFTELGDRTNREITNVGFGFSNFVRDNEIPGVDGRGVWGSVGVSGTEVLTYDRNYNAMYQPIWQTTTTTTTWTTRTTVTTITTTPVTTITYSDGSYRTEYGTVTERSIEFSVTTAGRPVVTNGTARAYGDLEAMGTAKNVNGPEVKENTITDYAANVILHMGVGQSDNYGRTYLTLLEGTAAVVITLFDTGNPPTYTVDVTDARLQ